MALRPADERGDPTSAGDSSLCRRSAEEVLNDDHAWRVVTRTKVGRSQGTPKRRSHPNYQIGQPWRPTGRRVSKEGPFIESPPHSVLARGNGVPEPVYVHTVSGLPKASSPAVLGGGLPLRVGRQARQNGDRCRAECKVLRDGRGVRGDAGRLGPVVDADDQDVAPSYRRARGSGRLRGALVGEVDLLGREVRVAAHDMFSTNHS